MLSDLHKTKYCIPLDYPIIMYHGVLYPKALPQPLKFGIEFAPVADIVVYSDATKPPKYHVNNLELEYRCVSSDYLAGQALNIGISSRQRNLL